MPCSRISNVVVYAVATLVFSGCGRLIDDEPFDQTGQLSWRVDVPNSESRGLWLWADLDCPSRRDGDDLVPNFALQGMLDVATEEITLYSGVLIYSDDGPPTPALSGRTSVGTSETCNNTGCTLRERVKVLDLEDATPGDTLFIDADLPMHGPGVVVYDAELQLRATGS